MRRPSSAFQLGYLRNRASSHVGDGTLGWANEHSNFSPRVSSVPVRRRNIEVELAGQQTAPIVHGVLRLLSWPAGSRAPRKTARTKRDSDTKRVRSGRHLHRDSNQRH